MEVVASGEVKRGKLRIRRSDRLAAGLAKLRDGEVVIRIERRHATRSAAQNAYLWGVCYQLLSEHTGFTVDELHEWAKCKFLPKHLTFADGNGEVVDEYVVGGSTRKLNKMEFGEYVEALRRFAAIELGVVIPDPNEYEGA